MHIYIYTCEDMCKYVTLYIMVAEITWRICASLVARGTLVAQFEETMTHGSPPVPMNFMVFYGKMGKMVIFYGKVLNYHFMTAGISAFLLRDHSNPTYFGGLELSPHILRSFKAPFCFIELAPGWPEIQTTNFRLGTFAPGTGSRGLVERLT